MTGEVLKRKFADECLRLNAEARRQGQPEPYLVLWHADGRHGPAEGMPDLRIIGGWAGRPTCVDIECKSAREKLRPAQVRYAEAAQRVAGDGYVYRVVRQTPEAPGELSALACCACLGLVELGRTMPRPGPGAVYGQGPDPAQPVSNPDELPDIGDPVIGGLRLSWWPDPARSRLREQLLREARATEAARRVSARLGGE